MQVDQKMTPTSGTTVLVSFDPDGGGRDVMIVDVSHDRTKVIITTPDLRQEGSPASALDFAKRMRETHGASAEVLVEAVERAAHFCLAHTKTERPLLQ